MKLREMMTTAGLSGEEIPKRMSIGMVRRPNLEGKDIFAKINKKKKKKRKKLMESEILLNPSKAKLIKYAESIRIEAGQEKDSVVKLRYVHTKSGIYIANAHDATHEDILRRIKEKDSIDLGFILYYGWDKTFKVQSRYRKKTKSSFLKRIAESVLLEELALVRFKYDNYKEDPRPQVKVLDFKYPGIAGQKTYGKREDLLGWNLNYFTNKRYARRAIDDITDFAKMLAASKKEMYERIKFFFPEQAAFLRRYMRKHVKGLRHRKNLLWRKTDYDKLEDINKDY